MENTDNLRDSFILTFQNNENRIIEILDGKIEVVGMLRELTKNKAIYIGKDRLNRIEICISIGAFLEIKDNIIFHGLTNNLVRLRTTVRTPLHYGLFPINHIDNEISRKRTPKK